MNFGHKFHIPKQEEMSLKHVSGNILIFYYYYYLGETESTWYCGQSGLLYQPQMIDDGDCGAIGGMKIGRGNQSTRRKPNPCHFVHHKSHMT
jgi:hypothetical protein